MSDLSHLDRYGRLLGSHQDDASLAGKRWKPANDLTDAAALRRIFSGLDDLRTKLSGDLLAKPGFSAFDKEIVQLGSRVMFETLWEMPRRRVGGQPALSGKFAIGGLWSAAARARMRKETNGLWVVAVPPRDHGNALMLEHVVPALSICRLARDMGGKDVPDAQLAAALSEVVAHVVMTYDDDALLASAPGSQGKNGKLLSAVAEQAIFNHYLGIQPLTAEELFRHRWSRYLSAAAFHGDRFDLASLAPLDPHLDGT